ncbi:MAG: hypothetical protein RR897_17395, partial [Pseudomonas sp.]
MSYRLLLQNPDYRVGGCAGWIGVSIDEKASCLAIRLRPTCTVQLPYRGDQLMIYEGKAITVKALESGIVELKF